MNQENTNEPLSKTAVMQSVLIEEMLQKLKFVLDCNNTSQAERMIEQFIFNQEELSIEFAQFCSKYTYNNYSKKWYRNFPLQNFPDYYTSFQLYEIFKRELFETVA